jgi:hypothetical protein
MTRGSPRPTARFVLPEHTLISLDLGPNQLPHFAGSCAGLPQGGQEILEVRPSEPTQRPISGIVHIRLPSLRPRTLHAKQRFLAMTRCSAAQLKARSTERMAL